MSESPFKTLIIYILIMAFFVLKVLYNNKKISIFANIDV